MKCIKNKLKSDCLQLYLQQFEQVISNIAFKFEDKRPVDCMEYQVWCIIQENRKYDNVYVGRLSYHIYFIFILYWDWYVTHRIQFYIIRLYRFIAKTLSLLILYIKMHIYILFTISNTRNTGACIIGQYLDWLGHGFSENTFGNCT